MTTVAPAVCPDIVESIYEAALEARGWQGVIESLRRASGSAQALMIAFDMQARTHAAVGKAGAIDDAIIAVCQARYSENIWTDAMGGVPPGQIVNLSTKVAFDDLAKTAFYADVLRPAGMAHGAAMLLDAGDGAWLSLGMGRTVRQGAFDDTHIDLFAAYVPHMRRAIGLAQRFDGLALMRRAELTALDALATAAALVDGVGRLVMANRAAAALDARGALTLSRDEVGCRDEAAAKAFRATVLAAASGAAPPPLRFHDPEGGALVLVASPVGGRAAERLAGEGAGRPAAALFVFAGGGGAGPAPEILRAMFGLTHAEARVASELALGDGETAAARRLGVSVNSLKTHRRRIFEKTGVARQAQLARLLARLPG